MKSIVFVGAGGTGSNLIPPAFRMIAFSKYKEIPIIIVDNDIVEDKNIIRQNFGFSDVGHYKSEVLCKRYASMYGLNVSYVTERLSKQNIFSIITLSPLIIDSVDNKATRRLISDYKASYSSWLSIGNSMDEGQVVYSDGYGMNVTELYPNDFSDEALRMEEKEINRPTCAINAEANPQSLAINNMASAIALNSLYELFYKDEITYKIVEFNSNNMTECYKDSSVFLGKNVDDEKLSNSLKFECESSGSDNVYTSANSGTS